MVPFLLERHAAVAQRSARPPCAGAGGLAAFWTLASPHRAPVTNCCGFCQARRKYQNFFLFLVLFCWFTLCFLLFGGYSEWAGPLGETQLPLLASF